MGKAVRAARAPKGREDRGDRFTPGANPFEQVQNKKFKKSVLGKKVKGGERDLSKSKQQALKDRTQGLLQDYKTRHRLSNFVDKRVGKGLDEETAAGMRLAKERKKEAKKMKFTL